MASLTFSFATYRPFTIIFQLFPFKVWRDERICKIIFFNSIPARRAIYFPAIFWPPSLSNVDNRWNWINDASTYFPRPVSSTRIKYQIYHIDPFSNELGGIFFFLSYKISNLLICSHIPRYLCFVNLSKNRLFCAASIFLISATANCSLFAGSRRSWNLLSAYLFPTWVFRRCFFVNFEGESSSAFGDVNPNVVDNFLSAFCQSSDAAFCTALFPGWRLLVVKKKKKSGTASELFCLTNGVLPPLPFLLFFLFSVWLRR